MTRSKPGKHAGMRMKPNSRPFASPTLQLLNWRAGDLRHASAHPVKLHDLALAQAPPVAATGWFSTG